MRYLKGSRTFVLLFGLMGMGNALAGCTMWAEPKTATWQNTTSSEQHVRLLWDSIQKKDWKQVEPRVASNMVWVTKSSNGSKAEFLAHLHALNTFEYSIGDLTVTPQGNDMVVVYSLMLKTADGAPGAGAIKVMSVWQQQKSGWILVAQSEQ